MEFQMPFMKGFQALLGKNRVEIGETKPRDISASERLSQWLEELGSQ